MLSTIAYILKDNKLENFILFMKEIILNEKFKIASFGSFVIYEASNYFIHDKGDFEDYLQYFCAQKEECCAIYTMHKKFPQLTAIPIKHYGDFNL